MVAAGLLLALIFARVLTAIWVFSTSTSSQAGGPPAGTSGVKGHVVPAKASAPPTAGPPAYANDSVAKTAAVHAPSSSVTTTMVTTTTVHAPSNLAAQRAVGGVLGASAGVVGVGLVA